MPALDGRVAVITGGSRGLGREMCLAFADEGASVVVASRKEAPCRALADEVTDRTGRPALGVGCHVGRWADCDRLVDVAYSHFGRVDVLVNNAGMSPPYPSLDQVTEDLFDKVLAVNLKGVFRLTAAVGTRMARGDGGAIVNVSSVAAVRPGPHELVYAAAKAGVNALTAGFAQAFGPSVRVNGIMPGPFLTDVAQAWDIPAAERSALRFPLGRLGRPDEIVGAALYLAGDGSSYTTGAMLTVDGGARWGSVL